MKKARDSHGSAPPPPKKPNAPPAATPDQPEDPNNKGTRAKVGRTAVPTKHIYVCYECGYEFTVAGKAHSLYCAKCRTILNQTDYTVSKRHDVPIKTAGTVTIDPEGIWKGKALSARDVILKGKHESGVIKAFRKFELHPGAEANFDEVETNLLVVHAGVTLKLTSPLKMKDVEVFGVIDGDVETTGRITIRAGGYVRGKLKTKFITIDEGGGLKADVVIGGQTEDEEPDDTPPKKHEPGDKKTPGEVTRPPSKMMRPNVGPLPPAGEKPKPGTKKAGESKDPPA